MQDTHTCNWFAPAHMLMLLLACDECHFVFQLLRSLVAGAKAGADTAGVKRKEKP